MSDPPSPSPSEALAEVEVRLSREVADLRKILTIDLPRHVRRCARTVFERSERADTMDDAALATLKRETEALAESLPAEVLAPLRELAPWTWPADQPFPKAPRALRDHPRLASALLEVEARLSAHLDAHGFAARAVGVRTAYAEPAYFVGGLYLKSVVANYWRALADFDALSREVRELEGADARAARRERWEQA